MRFRVFCDCVFGIYAATAVLTGCGSQSTSAVPAAHQSFSLKERVTPVLRSATAQEAVVHSFYGADGKTPQPGVIEDNTGALYGTTFDGGQSRACYGGPCGTVFKLIPTAQGYQEQVVHAFQNGSDGSFPAAGLVLDKAGAVYGETLCCYLGENGFGVLFKMVPSISRHPTATAERRSSPTDGGYAEKVLYSFKLSDALPVGQMIADAAGAFYDTSYQEGAHGKGSVFDLVPTASGYAENVLYSFQGGSDGAYPAAGLLEGKHGTLYGTTAFGGGGPCNEGAGCGTVFELTHSPNGYSERILHSFQGGHDGNQPGAPLIVDSTGALYGTTIYGGGAGSCPDGCGVVFKLTPAHRGFTESVLYNFSGTGSYVYSPVTIDRSGKLYGTTQQGGPTNAGTIYKLTPSGSGYVESDLHVFQGYPNDGSYTSTGLLLAKSGLLYGTTVFGGSGQPSQGCGNQLGCGTVFQLKP